MAFAAAAGAKPPLLARAERSVEGLRYFVPGFERNISDETLQRLAQRIDATPRRPHG